MKRDDNLLTELSNKTGTWARMRNLFKIATTCIKSANDNSGNININNIENVNIYLNTGSEGRLRDDIIDVDYE